MSDPSLREIAGSAWEESGNGTMQAKFLAGVMLAGLAFEWGTGNETLLGLVGSHTFDKTDSAVLTGVATGATSMMEQTILGITMALSLEQVPKTMQLLQDRFSRPEDAAKETKGIDGSKVMAALALGSSAYLVVDNVKEHKPRATNIRNAIGTSAIIAAGVTTIGLGASAITELGAEHGYAHEADTAVNVLSNPLSYLAVFGGVFALKKLKKALRRDSKN